MKNVAPVRKELGVRTIFNILGPLTNPAGAPNILMGVFHPDLVGIQVRALQRLGAEHALVVYGRDGMDEVSLGAATMVGELKNGEISEYEIHPEDFGLPMASNRALKVETPEQSRPDADERAGQPARRGARHRDPQRRRGACMRPTWSRRSRPASPRRAPPSSRARPRPSWSSWSACPSRWRPEGHVGHPGQDRRGQARGNRRRAEEDSARGHARRRGKPRADARLRRRAARARSPPARRGDRRDQEGQPEQGRAARGLHPRRHRAELCRSTAARLPVGADRPPVLPGPAPTT